jgi:hypothetical protein
MSKSKACVIYVHSLESRAAQLGALLAAEGFDVCLTEATAANAADAQEGNIVELPNAIKECLSGAEVCYFLVGDPVPARLIAAAESVLGGKQRVVVIRENLGALPAVFDDRAHAVVSATSPALPEVVKGKDVWEKDDGTTPSARVPDRVKCQ